jgi:hypothetical protein
VLMIPRIMSSESGSDSRMVRTFPALELTKFMNAVPNGI